MIGTAALAYIGGGTITGLATFIMKIWTKKMEADERKTMMLIDQTKISIDALDGVAQRTNNIWGNLSRFILLLTPQAIMLALLWIGYHNPDTVIWVGHQEEPWKFSFLGLVEFSGQKETTWRDFNGIVVLPIIFLQAGAVSAYYLIGGASSSR